MNKTKGFVLRLPEEDLERARQLAREMTYSENRLYAELIHEGLLMREQMLYMKRMRELGGRVNREEALALLERVADAEPEDFDQPR